MTIRSRTVIYLMMFGLFLSSNIIVPVHLLSHIQEAPHTHEVIGLNGEHHLTDILGVHSDPGSHGDETELLSCDVYHCLSALAMLDSNHTAFIAKLTDPYRGIVTPPQYHSLSHSLALIRAPPVLV